MNGKDLPKCFEGKTHKGDYLIEIYRVRDNGASPVGEEDVVYWCDLCGAVVVDVEYDRRRRGSIIPMRFPKDLIAKLGKS